MFKKSFLAVCSVGLATAFSAPAAAVEIMNKEESVSVKDLDLSSKADRTTLQQRLDAAVRKACGDRPAIRDFEAMAEYRLCLYNAEQSYKQQLTEVVRESKRNDRVAVRAGALTAVAMR